MKIYSIFKSVSGEVGPFPQGSTCVIVRLAGCNLRCQWPCDTLYAQKEEQGMELSISEVGDLILDHCSFLPRHKRRVMFTGGEPLLQQGDLSKLITWLTWNEAGGGFQYSIETNGSISPNIYQSNVSYVVDYKLPSSGMEGKMMSLEEFRHLPRGSFIKFVVNDGIDYDRAIVVMGDLRSMGIRSGITFAVSPTPNLPVDRLYQWIMRDGLDVVLSLQLHKYFNLSEPR